MSGGNLNPFKPGSIYEQIGQGVGHAVENIGKNPLPIIAAVALTVASGGLGIGAAAAEFVGAEGAMAAAVNAGVNSAIGNAASAALNGGNVSQIATAGIIGGLSAGAAAGLSGSELIKSVTDGMDPATVKMITASAGQSLGGAVTAILQGKDPLTGAISGAVQGALTNAFSPDQLTDMNQAAAKVLGNVAGATTSAALAGGNIPNAIANSAVYGSLKSSLGSAYDSFNQAQADFNKTYQDAQTKVPDLVQQAQSLLPQVQQQQQDAQDTYNKLQQYVSDYNTAKANNDSAGMTNAANAFNDLKPTYDTQLSTFNDNNSKLSDLSSQITNTQTTLSTQQQTLQDSSNQLKASYDAFATKLPELQKQQAQIDTTVSKLPDNYAAIYNDAVAKGQDGNAALAAAMQPYNQNVNAAKATIADMPESIQQKFTADLANKADPSTAAQDAQTNYTASVLSGLSGATGTGLNPALPAKGANVSGDFGMSAALPADTVMGTGLSGGGDIGVTYQIGANGLPAVDSNGELIKASSIGLTGAAPTTNSSGGAGINVSAKIPSGISTIGGVAPVVGGTLTSLGSGLGTTTAGTPSTTAATTDTGFADLKPTLIKGGQFKFANEPTFTEAPLTQITAPSTTSGALPDYTPQILAAAEGGLIQNMATGQMPESVGGASRPTILRGNPFQSLQRHFGVQLPGFQQQRFDTGGPVMQVSDNDGNSVEHRPEFFSEGGLNSLENTYVKGEGDGTSDSVAAMLADGEFVIPADVVSKLGNGSSDAGAKVLDEFLATIREHNQKHDPKKLPPTSKGALAYLLDAKRKVS